MNLRKKKILVTGGTGFLGKHVVNNLLYKRLVPRENLRIVGSKDYDLREKVASEHAVEGINVVIHLAAKVGGIGANQKYPGTFFYDNLMMGVNLMEAARLSKVKKFVSVGTICSYPKFTPVPFKEDDLWNGYPEETNAPYGLAKKMLLVQAQAYRQQYNFNAISLLPVNMYGPGDNYNDESSHVIPALIKKFSTAKKMKQHTVEVWGSGKATREFLYVADGAEAIVSATEKYDGGEPVNIGSSYEVSIKDLVEIIRNIMGYEGEVIWDLSKPDGQPRRKLDTTRAKQLFGFTAKTSFEEGLKQTILDYEKRYK